MRPKQLLTALGRLEIERAYSVGPYCHHSQIPRDRELDGEGSACSPGVRRMMALVGSQGSFDHGREELASLAGLEVTAKAVERHAEAIGAAIAAGEQAEMQRAKQLGLRPSDLTPFANPSLTVGASMRRPPGVKRNRRVAGFCLCSSPLSLV
jgi:hypothetical protein